MAVADAEQKVRGDERLGQSLVTAGVGPAGEGRCVFELDVEFARAAGKELGGDGEVRAEVGRGVDSERERSADEEVGVHGGALDGLVPVEGLVSEGMGICRWCGGLAEELEEAELQVEGGILAGFKETLGDEAEGFGWALRLGVDARVEGAEVPALTVLNGGGSIGIEDVSLVEDGGGDLFDRGEVHASTSSGVRV